MNNKIEKYYFKCLLIREFEKKVEELFEKGKLFGTTHGYIGQEIIAVSLLDKINISKDSVTGTHRSHGHYLSLFEDPESLFSELMGKKSGVVKGKGGSQHLKRDNFYTNGITGGMVPVATGIANTEKLNNTGNIVISFLGDGAMNEGYVFESFNFSVINELPILFALENNKYAMSTSYNKTSAGDFTTRIKSLNMKTFEVQTDSYEYVEEISKKAVKYVRNHKKPAFIHFHTYRFCGHSKSDNCEYRSDKEEKEWKNKDVLIKLKKRLNNKKALTIEKEVDEIIKNSLSKSENAKWPIPSDIYNN